MNIYSSDNNWIKFFKQLNIESVSSQEFFEATTYLSIFYYVLYIIIFIFKELGEKNGVFE